MLTSRDVDKVYFHIPEKKNTNILKGSSNILSNKQQNNYELYCYLHHHKTTTLIYSENFLISCLHFSCDANTQNISKTHSKACLLRTSQHACPFIGRGDSEYTQEMQEVLGFMQLPEITSPNGPNLASFPCDRNIYSALQSWWEMLTPSLRHITIRDTVWASLIIPLWNVCPALLSFLLSNLSPRLHRAAQNFSKCHVSLWMQKGNRLDGITGRLQGWREGSAVKCYGSTFCSF